jgi:hypothetical protein
MQIQAAVVREQGQTFAVVLVKPHVLTSSQEAGDTITAFQPCFPGMPVVLAASSGGSMRYYGRRDISRFLASISAARLPWRTFSIAG